MADFRIDWLGPGHSRSDLYCVRDRYGKRDELTGKAAQLFRGTRAECKLWVAEHEYPPCPACAAQAESGPWPDHAPGCPDAPVSEFEELESLPEATMQSEPGTRVRVSELRGYVLHQDRPGPCRVWGIDPRTGKGSHGCKCGECGGRTVTFAATVERVVFWADNSREVFVVDDDGERHIVRLAGPSGDVCF